MPNYITGIDYITSYLDSVANDNAEHSDTRATALRNAAEIRAEPRLHPPTPVFWIDPSPNPPLIIYPYAPRSNAREKKLHDFITNLFDQEIPVELRDALLAHELRLWLPKVKPPTPDPRPWVGYHPHIERFVSECCNLSGHVRPSDLQMAYQQWALKNDQPPLPNTKYLGLVLTELYPHLKGARRMMTGPRIGQRYAVKEGISLK